MDVRGEQEAECCQNLSRIVSILSQKYLQFGPVNCLSEIVLEGSEDCSSSERGALPALALGLGGGGAW